MSLDDAYPTACPPATVISVYICELHEYELCVYLGCTSMSMKVRTSVSMSTSASLSTSALVFYCPSM